MTWPTLCLCWLLWAISSYAKCNQVLSIGRNHGNYLTRNKVFAITSLPKVNAGATKRHVSQENQMKGREAQTDKVAKYSAVSDHGLNIKPLALEYRRRNRVTPVSMTRRKRQSKTCPDDEDKEVVFSELRTEVVLPCPDLKKWYSLSEGGEKVHIPIQEDTAHVFNGNNLSLGMYAGQFHCYICHRTGKPKLYFEVKEITAPHSPPDCPSGFTAFTNQGKVCYKVGHTNLTDVNITAACVSWGATLGDGFVKYLGNDAWKVCVAGCGEECAMMATDGWNDANCTDAAVRICQSDPKSDSSAHDKTVGAVDATTAGVTPTTTEPTLATSRDDGRKKTTTPTPTAQNNTILIVSVVLGVVGFLLILGFIFCCWKKWRCHCCKKGVCNHQGCDCCERRACCRRKRPSSVVQSESSVAESSTLTSSVKTTSTVRSDDTGVLASFVAIPSNIYTYFVGEPSSSVDPPM